MEQTALANFLVSLCLCKLSEALSVSPSLHTVSPMSLQYLVIRKDPGAPARMRKGRVRELHPRELVGCMDFKPWWPPRQQRSGEGTLLPFHGRICGCPDAPGPAAHCSRASACRGEPGPQGACPGAPSTLGWLCKPTAGASVLVETPQTTDVSPEFPGGPATTYSGPILWPKPP